MQKYFWKLPHNPERMFILPVTAPSSKKIAHLCPVSFQVPVLKMSTKGYEQIISPYNINTHSRPQRPRSFWSAPRIATSGQLQRHSGFEWICKHNRLRPEPIRFVRLDLEHAQSDGKSVNRGLPLLDTARGLDSCC